MYNKAIDWEILSGQNPTDRIKKFPEKSRERFLQPDEFPRFFKAVNEEANTTIRDYILISLLTGARRTNAVEMRWEQINFEHGTWTIPVTKSGDSHTVPLVPEAMEILMARKSDSESEWVFPGTGETGHLVEPTKAWRNILKRAGIKDLRLHDLRRTMGSWQASTGASLSVIGKSLAHKNVSTTAIYARLHLDPVRDAMSKATSAMMEAGKIKAPAKITNIRQG
jgi:integrase